MAKHVTVKEFSAEQAGERVGWVAVTPEEFEEDRVIKISMVAATVGIHGASYGYEDLSGYGEGRGYHRNSSTGFENTFSMTATLFEDQATKPFDERSCEVTWQSRTPASSQLLNAAGQRGEAPGEDQKIWVEGTANLSQELRTAVQKSGFRQHYPTIYYVLNGYIGHAGIRSGQTELDTRTPNIFIPDATMAEATVQQLDISTKIDETLRGIADIDRKTRSALKTNSEPEMLTSPDLFIASRRIVQALEEEAERLTSGLMVEALAYLPIGFRPNGRTYPFMGAHPELDVSDNGPELIAIKKGNPEPAVNELNKELRELQHRARWAQQGTAVLRMLGVAEKLAKVS